MPVLKSYQEAIGLRMEAQELNAGNVFPDELN